MQAKEQKRIGAYRRLEAQLAEGTKRDKEGNEFPLTEKDVTRIKAEMSVLRGRVPSLGN